MHDVCHEDEVKAIATAMLHNGMHAAGYTYVNLGTITLLRTTFRFSTHHISLAACADDCWIYPNRTANGALQPDPTRFPTGMAALADWLHAREFKFGLYTSGGYATCSNGHNDPTDPLHNSTVETTTLVIHLTVAAITLTRL